MPTSHPAFAAPLPTLETPRLRLRAFTPADAGALHAHLQDERIARNTLTIPHPYPDGAADAFIALLGPSWGDGKRGTWAVTEREGGALVGAMGLVFVHAHHRAELGYWIAVDRWGRGYASEAASRVIAFGFDVLGLHRIEAHHYPENPGSGRVLQKVGMTHEGFHRAVVWRNGTPKDNVSYAILRTDPRP